MKACNCEAPDTDYNEEYDARFCKRCDRWLETACDDPHCTYKCTTRPEKPSDAVRSGTATV